nr:hypothetical protein [Tanacetum cinerariifolium]
MMKDLVVQMPVHIIVKDTRTMDMIIDQQVAFDEALVPHESRLRIGKSIFYLRSDITSKESTLQLATVTVHHHSIWFKMGNKKRIVNLEYFREMMYICLRIPSQTFDELPFEEEILAFLKFLGHNEEIRKLTDVNINKLHQPWRSFAAVINKCLSGKSTGYDNFVYQVEHKDAKKSNKMYYPRFTKVIIHYFMTKDPSIPRRNKVNWHYVKDEQMFTTIKLVSRHQNTQQFCVMLPVELTNEDIKNSEAYKDYYAVASGSAPRKTKASVRKTKSSYDTTITPPTSAGTRLSTFAKGKQPANASKAKNEGSGIIPGVPDVPTKESDEEISWKSSDEDDDVHERSDDQDDDDDDDQDTDNEGDEFIHPKISIHKEEETKDEESFDPIVQTPKNSDDEGNDDASLGLNVGSEEGHDAEDDEDELYKDVNINLEGRDFARAVFSILGVVQRYMDQQMNEAVKVVVQIQSDRFQDEDQAKNEEFLKILDENIQKIIKEQVKEQAKMKNPPLDQIRGLRDEEKVKSQSQQALQRRKQPRPLASLLKGPNLNKRLQASLHQQRSQCRQLKIWKSPHIKSLKQADSRSFFNDLVNTPVDFLAFLMNRLKVDTLTPELLAGLTFELMKGSCKSLVELKFFLEEVYKATTDQLDWNNPEGQQYPHNLLKPLPLIPNSQSRHVIPFDHFINNDLEYLRGSASRPINRESTRDVYSKRRIITVTDLQIVEWHNYKHLDWITMCRDDDKLYKFKEGGFKRLRIQDIEDMLLLLLGVESYQKKLNLTNLDTYHSYLKRKEAYTAYSNPRGFIYQNKDKQNRLMRIDELHKFNDETLNDVRTTLDDRLKGIRMKYLPQAIWRKSDKERAARMIQSIDK